jgi:glycosyltransferase involved in cell wall biosynthesis
MLRISVVIPVYNGERFIGEALQSVLDQTYPAFEIIVVDDGSTDATEGMIREISSPIPVGYYRQENQGAGAARNLGVSVARGDWVAFLDSDDLWSPQKLAVQVRYLEDHPEADFVYSNVQVTDEGGHPIFHVRQLFFEPVVFQDRPFAQLSTVVMRRELFRKTGGFPEGLRLYEDLALFARIARLTSMHFIQGDLATYRFHPAQSTRNPTLQIACWAAFLHFMAELYLSDPPTHPAVIRHLTKSLEDHCKHYIRTGDFRQAQRFARLAFAYKRSWKNLRRLVISFLPGLRALYYRTRSDSIGE